MAKLVALLTLFAVIISLLPASVFAQEAPTEPTEPATVVDVCLNIDGVQDVVPTDMVLDIATNECVAKVVDPVPPTEPQSRVGAKLASVVVEDNGEDTPMKCIGENLLTNGSFEEPTVSGQWNIFSSVLGWLSSAGELELWKNFNGSGADSAADGVQNAELDGNTPTTISQTLTVVPGDKYQISFAFSPRAGTAASDNKVSVVWDGVNQGVVGVDGSTNSGNVWTNHNYIVTAGDNSALFELMDKGTANSLGTLVDNVRVCLVEHEVENTVSGYKFNDKNANGIWDKETEDGISGWEINLDQEGASTTHATTDANGYYSFPVNPGFYKVTETNQKGWEQTALVGEGADGDTCYISVGDTLEKSESTSEQIIVNDTCTFGNHQRVEIINTCLVPDSLSDEGVITLQNSGEKSVAQMLADHGYSAVDVNADQKNYQVWNLADLTASAVTFKMRVLGKRAGNSQIVGYYKAGNTITFTPVLSQSADTDGETVVTVTIPATFANSFGFAIKSADKTWFSEKSLNDDGSLDHIAVYNPSANTYLLAFEDFNNLGDGDYNDIVIEISNVTCEKTVGGGDEVVVTRGGGGGGSRVKRTPTGEVLGASSSTPIGLVLGDATSTLPVGAPNTGAGGSSSIVVQLPTIVAILPKTQKIK